MQVSITHAYGSELGSFQNVKVIADLSDSISFQLEDGECFAFGKTKKFGDKYRSAVFIDQNNCIIYSDFMSHAFNGTKEEIEKLLHSIQHAETFPYRWSKQAA